MAYEICKECGRFFEKNGRTLCNRCYEKDRKQYAIVKDFIASHQGVTALDVINQTRVSLRTIRRYIEDGMLEYACETTNNGEILEIKKR